MPQIVSSLLPTAPAMPAAATPAPASATSAMAPGMLLPPDPTSPNFLAQFKAALKTIANVVVQPQLTQRPVADPNTAPLLSAVPDEQPAAETGKDVDASMPDLLAQLGFAVVPAVFPMLVTSQAVASGAPTAPERIAQTQLPQSAPLLATAPPATLSQVMLQASVVPLQVPVTGQDPQKTQAAPVASLIQTLPDAHPGQTRPTTARQIGAAISDLRRGQPGPDVLGQALPQTAPISAPVTHQPIEHLKPADQPQKPTVQPATATTSDLSATVMLPATPGAPLPTPAAPTATSAPQIRLLQPAAQDGASLSNSAGSDHSRHTPDKVASVSSEVTTAQDVPASDAAMAAAAATTVNAAPLPMPVSPSQVVSQIARHADVIRLPGNRGLHIQLHPDDLGGVQVTVRYAPGGGVELHINAEHAATGALVQAGWTELRDALASHGITADRLMMSVTSPPGAGQADLSGNSGNRSDPNPSSSGQASLSSPDGQSQGQSRQDHAQQRTSPTWGGPEPVASTDDNPRVASATGSPSRIDYRV